MRSGKPAPSLAKHRATRIAAAIDSWPAQFRFVKKAANVGAAGKQSEGKSDRRKFRGRNFVIHCGKRVATAGSSLLRAACRNSLWRKASMPPGFRVDMAP